MQLWPKTLHWSLLLLLSTLAGCYSSGFHLKQVGKTDVDMVSDIVIAEIDTQLRRLTTKLYKRNPNQLKKLSAMTVDKRLSMLFDNAGRLQFTELHGSEELEALNLALDPVYQGDRVFALMVGLTGMLRKSYGYDSDFYFYEELDPQLLYNSARNIEVLAWKLKRLDSVGGVPLIITYKHNGRIDNLSFERIYGKLIHTQDVMAKIVADQDNRTIKTVIQTSLSMFLPI